MGVFTFFKRIALPGELLAHPRAQAGASTPPSEWSARRAPLTELDRVLVSETHHWLRGIPRLFHPRRLCIEHPRAANRIARAWQDADQVDQLLHDLLSDRRGNREGFSPRIVEELKLLRLYHEHPAAAWHSAAALARRRLAPQSAAGARAAG
jgi:hypothetical protein